MCMAAQPCEMCSRHLRSARFGSTDGRSVARGRRRSRSWHWLTTKRADPRSRPLEARPAGQGQSSRPGPATAPYVHVTACAADVALFVAFGGTSVAAVTALAPNNVGTLQLRNKWPKGDGLRAAGARTRRQKES